MLFVGTHERQLDDKGRLAMPAPFRTHLGEHCYVVFGPDRCLEVYPSAPFEQIAATLMERVDRGEVSRQRQRVVSSSATLVTLDRQGRITLDENARPYAGISTQQQVVVTGNFRLLAIWSPAQFELVTEEGRTDLAGSRASA